MPNDFTTNFGKVLDRHQYMFYGKSVQLVDFLEKKSLLSSTLRHAT